MKDYKPHKNGFPYKLLKYLFDNGKSPGADIQESIGLNAWADNKGKIYYSRASIRFDVIATRLSDIGLINKLKDDYYELTKKGKEFMLKYNPR